ncbi:MAG: 16S rRNA (guanine(527)-N(7))-methyltransferase RsmG [Lachnospiraceae bacterium]|nr:16S rRNA (guanine(527)-N(7))-methyltransferase RsmG [Lachnospiraceae bacterium]
MPDRSLLQKDLSAWKIVASEEQLLQTERYFALLSEWNAKMNLTAIGSWEDFCRLHVTDSLALFPFLPEDVLPVSREKEGIRLADIGSGAGFPGMVLQIFCPSWQVTLIEAQGKRVQFLEALCRELFPSDAETKILQLRAEDAGREEALRERFDLCTARAVAALPVLLEYALPLLAVGGIFAAYKSSDTDPELADARRALDVLGGEITEVKDYLLPGTTIARRLVFVQKLRATPEKYPRRAGMPKKRPL